MVFDGIVTRAVAHELSHALASGRLMKVHQPTNTEIILTIRSKGENQSLLLSAHPSYARIHITTDSYQNPKEPSMFCMLLRKHIVGGFIDKIEQHEMERIIHIDIKGKNEIGDETNKRLVIEIMGKHSNIVLIDQEKEYILDSIKHVSHAQSRYRTILPGQAYKLPPDQGKINPLSIDGASFVKKLDFNAGKLDNQMVSKIMGLSPFISKEISNLAHLGSQFEYKEAFEVVQTWILRHEYKPAIFKREKDDFHVLPFQSIGEEGEIFSSVSTMLDHYYSGKAERDRVKQQAGDLLRFLKNEREKNTRKMKKHQQTIQKAEKADHYQRLGELLTAHLHTIKTGDKVAQVIDYYDPDQKEITIELNPNKTPSENAQSYFKTYQKLKKSKQMVIQEIEKAEQENAYLDALVQQIDGAREQDIEGIREELREEGYLKAKPKQKKKSQKPKHPEPEQFISTDGATILVGKNNKQNEYLTTRLADKNDIWLHTKDIPGSHVVIRDKNPSEETLFEAAQLAAIFSKSKQSSSVPVDYTKVRHVKKPNGAKPGYVTYDNQKTLFVTPEADFLTKLKTMKE
ncbi:NFACT family protein [Aquibacillus sp. 3ASR75-11]|uniref:Rqc2 homolog RqcH n=1 Tax=Terrihalobacillus insolitus TaxID=2950438 RepID=A0A9X4AL00_9BACI|nr:NFACT RNA binding domain-containing protein [Terrihalobacillus insolitus]MDC3423641.1 NFACT family protein [Terrihalobacillus insolitus]